MKNSQPNPKNSTCRRDKAHNISIQQLAKHKATSPLTTDERNGRKRAGPNYPRSTKD